MGVPWQVIGRHVYVLSLQVVEYRKRFHRGILTDIAHHMDGHVLRGQFFEIGFGIFYCHGLNRSECSQSGLADYVFVSVKLLEIIHRGDRRRVGHSSPDLGLYRLLNPIEFILVPTRFG